MPDGYERRGEAITRREFEAVIRPMQKDIERIMSIATSASSTWNNQYELQRERLGRVERQVIFAQGAIAAIAFLIGSGALGTLFFFLLQS